MRLGEPDESGRRRPMPIPGSEFVIPVDYVIEAIGETTDLSFLPEGVRLTRRGAIEADPATCETGVPGLFAGGDVVTGPLSVIDAIAAGIRAAGAIDLYLRGEDLGALRAEGIEEATWVKDETVIEERPKQEEALLPVEERRGNFEEVELGLTSIQGMMEALRCVHCGPCAECLVDEGFCEHDTPEIDEEACSGCGTCVSICPFEAMSKDEEGIAQVDEALCKGCGLCAASCPERAITMTTFSNELLMEAIAR
jgi:heterodisulfide reductase subunit A-like polyferredoxin